MLEGYSRKFYFLGNVTVLWDNRSMVRPPLGPVTMTYTVKFRLSDADMADLRDIAGGASLSEALRQMIKDEKKRRKGKS